MYYISVRLLKLDFCMKIVANIQLLLLSGSHCTGCPRRSRFRLFVENILCLQSCFAVRDVFPQLFAVSLHTDAVSLKQYFTKKRGLHVIGCTRLYDK